MVASTYNITIEQGATFAKDIVLTDADGVVEDLTDYTARMQIRENKTDTSFLIELTTENGRITITPVEGRIDLVITAADTTDLSFDNAVYDLEIVNNGVVRRLLEGDV